MRHAVLAGLLASIVSACGSTGTLAPGRTPVPRCDDGRPQSEMDAAGRLLIEPHSAELVCVLIASGQDRVYRLRDGRTLHIYEHDGALPAKPTATPLAAGSRTVRGATWSWMRVNGLTLLMTMSGGTYVELAVAETVPDQDVAYLAAIAATMRR